MLLSRPTGTMMFGFDTVIVQERASALIVESRLPTGTACRGNGIRFIQILRLGRVAGLCDQAMCQTTEMNFFQFFLS